MREGGFDCVIGNPPYVRIQHMKEWAPFEVEHYKEHYRSASSGNYDIYVVFVEKGLSVLRKGGRLGYILPHKFFNAKYGEPLRRLIAEGKHLSEVVHFGDQQVFEGATNYTCLLFLEKDGRSKFQFAKVHDLEAWRNAVAAPVAGTVAEVGACPDAGRDRRPLLEEKPALIERRYNSERRSSGDKPPTFGSAATEGVIPASQATGSEWNFTVGKSASLFEKLAQVPVKLENVTTRIFQGIKTSADAIYIVEEVARRSSRVRVYSRQTESEYWLEPALLHLLVKGGDSKRYHLARTDRLVLFPYATDGNEAGRLIPEKMMKSKYPMTWKYLLDNRVYLERREGGGLRVPEWYAFGRNQALDVMPLPKIFTPDIAARASFSLDPAGDAFFTGGVAGGYGILLKPGQSREYILALLNSRLLEWYIRQTATQMRGGYYSYESRFIRHLPIRTINFSDPADKARHDKIIELVERMLALNKEKHSGRLAPSELERVERDIASTDAEIDEFVYDLYGITEDERKIIEKAL